MQQFAFDNERFQGLLSKVGLNTYGANGPRVMVAIYLSVCWLPLAVYALLHGVFWTGQIQTSFITHFDTQARLLVTLPLLILIQRKVSEQLGKILSHFPESGIIAKADHSRFKQIIAKNVNFIKSWWVDAGLLLLCYLQVYFVLHYETDFATLLSWQTIEVNGKLTLNFGGKWDAYISSPLMLFMLYRWLLRVIVWGNILRKISNLNLKLYVLHPDRMGGLSFLAITFRFFAPVAFAMSAVVAGNFADFMLLASKHLVDLWIIFAVYLVFITLLFGLPLMTFRNALNMAREDAIFNYYDLANGMNREMARRIAAKHFKVVGKDLDTQHYSTINDFNSVVQNALRMKSLPFTFKDLKPLWIASVIPFVPVIFIEIPVLEVLKTLFGLLF
jgi:hypothetical protein